MCVIDVMYLVENSDYARAVLQLALATHDEELCRYALRLNSILANLMDADAEITPPQTAAQQLVAVENMENIDDLTEPTAEEIYQAQVSHHYIGALRWVGNGTDFAYTALMLCRLLYVKIDQPDIYQPHIKMIG